MRRLKGIDVRDLILGGAALQRCNHFARLPTALAAEVAL
jgi:hypothetical protein